MDIDIPQKLADLAARSEKERKRFYARKPKGIANVIASVMSKQGYAASKAASELTGQWEGVAEKVLGDAALSKQTRAKGLSRGKLEVIVANHVVMQEINFHRPQLLKSIQDATPDSRINEIRFKVGRID